MKRRYNLATLEGLRREMCAIYRRTRDGKIDTPDGSRLVFMLSQIGKVLELVEIEKRLARLEDLAHARRT